MTFQQLRKTKFRTAKELATAVDMPAPRIQKWENGGCTPRPCHWRKLADVLGVSIEELLNCFEESQK